MNSIEHLCINRWNYTFSNSAKVIKSIRQGTALSISEFAEKINIFPEDLIAVENEEKIASKEIFTNIANSVRPNNPQPFLILMTLASLDPIRDLPNNHKKRLFLEAFPTYTESVMKILQCLLTE